MPKVCIRLWDSFIAELKTRDGKRRMLMCACFPGLSHPWWVFVDVQSEERPDLHPIQAHNKILVALHACGMIIARVPYEASRHIPSRHIPTTRFLRHCMALLWLRPQVTCPPGTGTSSTLVLEAGGSGAHVLLMEMVASR